MDYNRWNGDEDAFKRYFGRFSNRVDMPPNLAEPPGNPEPTANRGLFKAQCLVSTLFTRTGPSSLEPVIGKLRLGEVVTVYEVHKGWFRLHPRDAVWCQGKSNLFRRLNVLATKGAVLFSTRVIVPALYKRAGPGKEHRVTGNLIRDEIVNVYEEREGWYRIAPDVGVWINAGSQYSQKV